jgi:4-amino-4-deoxychorismate lyase
MSLFFETLKVTKGKIENLFYHNKRVNHTIETIFHQPSSIDLSKHIFQKDFTKERCKVIYDKEIKTIQFFPIKPRIFQSFKIIETNITYNFKSVDREEIDNLFLQKGNCDDILMVKDGLVTDTSIANIAIFDGQTWMTPKVPLLRGTLRESLIEKQLLLEKDVKIEDIKNAQGFALMNALLGFQIVTGAEFR